MTNLKVAEDQHQGVPDLAPCSEAGNLVLPAGNLSRDTASVIPEGHNGKARVPDRISVVSISGKPLMPCKWRKAKKLVTGGVAKFKTSKLGIRYLQMLIEIGDEIQDVALGLDNGSKFSGIAVASREQVHTQIMLELPTEIKKKVAQRRVLRRSRRYRLNSSRQHRFLNRTNKNLPPSIRSRKQFELRIIRELTKLFPINHISVEDIRFNHYRKRWGSQFSLVEMGKNWLFGQLEEVGRLSKSRGFETKAERERIGLRKVSSKNARRPESHTTDAVALCSLVLENIKGLTSEFFIARRAPISRRQLHLQNFARSGVRRKYGGTWTPLGKKGSLVKIKLKHETLLGYISGYTKNLISVSSFDWCRLGRFSKKNCELIHQYPGFLITEEIRKDDKPQFS